MIQTFIDRFLAKKPELEAGFSEKPPEDYKDIVTRTIRLIADEDEYGDNNPDPGFSRSLKRSMTAITKARWCSSSARRDTSPAITGM